MTLQTELVGEPAELKTIVDFRGRVLKTWRSSFRVDPQSPAAPERIRAWHGEIEQRLRRQLAAVARRRTQEDAHGSVLAELFIAAMQAYGQRELSTARALFEVCEHLQPGNPRVRAALERTRDHTLSSH